jgi:hypothetical protein
MRWERWLDPQKEIIRNLRRHSAINSSSTNGIIESVMAIIHAHRNIGRMTMDSN